jgi:hypothetical protein
VVLGAHNVATTDTSISAEWSSGAIPLILHADDNRAPALRTVGRIQFLDRSGRATVLKGRMSVDVDFRYPNVIGLEGTPLCFANVMSYRPGVFVTMVRPNYPVRNKMRIYLNRTVTSNTFVAWLILN